MILLWCALAIVGVYGLGWLLLRVAYNVWHGGKQ